jgi:Uma2 family endonuclease
MSAAPKSRKLTAAEYFTIEEKSDVKHEFFDGEMFAMAGASREHNALTRNLVIELGGRLKGGPCEVFVADQRVKVDRTGLFTYPDVLIVCGPAEYAPENRDTLTNPRVVIEVLSDSTERYDRTTKFRHYQRLPSLQEYVLVPNTNRRSSGSPARPTGFGAHRVRGTGRRDGAGHRPGPGAAGRRLPRGRVPAAGPPVRPAGPLTKCRGRRTE